MSSQITDVNVEWSGAVNTDSSCKTRKHRAGGDVNCKIIKEIDHRGILAKGFWK